VDFCGFCDNLFLGKFSHVRFEDYTLRIEVLMSAIKRSKEHRDTPTRHIVFKIRRPIDTEAIARSIGGPPEHVVPLAVRKIGPSPKCRPQGKRVLECDFRSLTPEKDGSNRVVADGFVRLSKAGQPVHFRLVFCTKPVAGQCSYGSLTVITS
jgi:hypothetical protein